MDGIDYLSRFIQDRLDSNERAAASRHLTPFDYLEVKGLIHGLVAASALSDADAERVLQDHYRLSPTVSGNVQLQPSENSAGIVRAVQAAAKSYVSNAAPQGQGVSPKPLRVIPVLDAAPQLVSRIIFLSLEVWSSMIAVRVVYPAGTIPPVELVRQQSEWKAVDNTGREYRETGRVDSDMQGIVFCTRFFTPGPISNSATLTISVTDLLTSREETVDLPLH